MSDEEYNPETDYTGARGHAAADRMIRERGYDALRSQPKSHYRPPEIPAEEMTTDEMIKYQERKIKEAKEKGDEGLQRMYQRHLEILKEAKRTQQNS